MPVVPPIVTGFTAGILIAGQMLLLVLVVLARRRNRQSLGDGSNPDLLRAVRRHGNFAENAAIFLVAFALFEMLGGSRFVLEILCAGFVLGRLSHAVGLSFKNALNPFRIGGIVVTVIVGITLGTRLLQLTLPLLHLF